MEGGVGYHMTGLNKAKLLSDNSTIWIQNGERAFTQTENKYPGTNLFIYESITMPGKKILIMCGRRMLTKKRTGMFSLTTMLW